MVHFRVSSPSTIVPNWLQRIRGYRPVSPRLGQKSGQKEPAPAESASLRDLLASRRGGTHAVATQCMVHDPPLDGDFSCPRTPSRVRAGLRVESHPRCIARSVTARPTKVYTDGHLLCRISPMTSPGLERLPTTFTYAQALDAGLTHHRLYSLSDTGQLDQVGRGLYRKADDDLTDAIPARHDIALPRDKWHPRLGGVVRWHSFDRATFDIGRTTVPVDDTTTIGLYSAPRTIVDTYRLRNTAGSDVANEALRRWLRGGGPPAQLVAVARAFPRAMPALLNAFEVLL